MSGLVSQNKAKIIFAVLLLMILPMVSCFAQDEVIKEDQIVYQYSENSIDDIYTALTVLRDLADAIFNEDNLDEIASGGTITLDKKALDGIDLSELDWSKVSQINLNNYTRVKGALLRDQKEIAALKYEICKVKNDKSVCDLSSPKQDLEKANEAFLEFVKNNHWIE